MKPPRPQRRSSETPAWCWQCVHDEFLRRGLSKAEAAAGSQFVIDKGHTRVCKGCGQLRQTVIVEEDPAMKHRAGELVSALLHLDASNLPVGTSCLACETCKALVVVTLPDETARCLADPKARQLVDLMRIIGVAMFAVDHSGHSLTKIDIEDRGS